MTPEEVIYFEGRNAAHYQKLLLRFAFFTVGPAALPPACALQSS